MIYVFLADGFEEIEALTPVDILRRANIDVKTVGIGSNCIKGSHNISVNCDIIENQISYENLQGIVLPGGLPGAVNLENSSAVQKAINYCIDNGLLVSAICAAPQILGHKGILKGKSATCFPGFENELTGANVLNQKVVRDGNIITAWGAGAAAEFGFEILSYLTNLETAKTLKNTMKF